MIKTSRLSRTAIAVAGFAFAAALTIGAASAAPPVGQPPKPAATGTPAPKILVINRSLILQNSKVGQDIVRQVQGFTSSAETEFKSEGEGLRRDGQALQQQIAILAADVKAKKIRDFQARQAAFQAKVQSRQGQIQYGVLKARQQVEQALGPILQGIMSERGANLLLDRQAIVLGTVDVDVTQTAIQRLDQKLPSVKVQLTTPPPGFMQQQQGQ